MSANDLMHDMKKESKTAGEWFLLFLASPLIAYYFVMGVIDYLVETNRTYADKLFLKRIRMSQAEFEDFLYWKRNEMNKIFKNGSPDLDDDERVKIQKIIDDENEPSDEELRERYGNPVVTIERPGDIKPMPIQVLGDPKATDFIDYTWGTEE